jgi:hypothetical protein
MPIPSAWVDRIFARLSIRYGAPFLAQWPDAAPDVIKADWAKVLANLSMDDIAYGLENLPAAPPKAMAFRDLCLSAPRPATKLLPEPKASPELVRRVAKTIADCQESVQESRRGRTPAQIALANILAICQRNRSMSASQRDFVATCAQMVPADDPVRVALEAFR